MSLPHPTPTAALPSSRAIVVSDLRSLWVVTGTDEPTYRSPSKP